MTQLSATTLLVTSASDAAGRDNSSRTAQANTGEFATMFANQQAERVDAAPTNTPSVPRNARQKSDTDTPIALATPTAEVKPAPAQRDLFNRAILTDEEAAAAVAADGDDWLALVEAMQTQLQNAEEPNTAAAENVAENVAENAAKNAAEQFEAWFSELPEDVQSSLRQVFAELDLQAFAATMAPYLSKLENGEAVSGAAMLRDLQTQFPQLKATELAAAATTTMLWQQFNSGDSDATAKQLKLLPADAEQGNLNTQAALTASLKELMRAATAAPQANDAEQAELAAQLNREQRLTTAAAVDGRPLKAGAPVESPRLAALLAQLQAMTGNQEQASAQRQATTDAAKQIEQTAKQLLQAAQAADDAKAATADNAMLAAVKAKGVDAQNGDKSAGANAINGAADGKTAELKGTDGKPSDVKPELKPELKAELKPELAAELKQDARAELKADASAVETKAVETKPQSALLNMLQQAREAAQTVKTQPTQFEQTLRQAQQPLPLVAEQASQVLRERVMLMLGNGIQRADIRLDPPDLGSMSIRLSIQNDQAQVSFQVQNPQARDSIEQALPRLREMLEQQGLQLAGSDVSEQGKGGHAGTEGDGSAAGQQAQAEADWQVEVALNAGEPLEPGRVDFFV